jgi:drug/metabolite transporter (DMT)-like permease
MKKSLPKIYLAFGALLLATVIWGAATVVIKLTLESVPLFSFLFYRFLIVCSILLPFVILEIKKHPISRKDIPTLILLGLTGQSAILLVFAGIKLTTAIDAALIGASAPLIIIAAGHYFYKDKINKALEVGIVIATFGTLVVVIEPALSEHAVNQSSLLRILGNVLVVLYNLVFAAYIILSKKVMGQKSSNVSKTLTKLRIRPLNTNYTPFMHTAISFYVALATFIPLAILEWLGVFGDYSFSLLDIQAVALFGILYMALISSVVAYIAFQWGLHNAKVSDAGIFGYLGPVFTIPFAFALLGETPTSMAVLGTAIIVFGVVIAEKYKM